MKIEDNIGETFGRLKVLEVVVIQGKSRNRKGFECSCSCGNEIVVRADSVLSGRTRSCGCYNMEKRIERNTGNTWRRYDGPQSSINGVYARYRCSANNRGYAFNLTKEQFESLIFQNCYYCSAVPSRYFKNPSAIEGILCNGVDRVDNSKGYDIENCVPCCSDCNYNKKDVSMEIARKMVEFEDEK